MVTTAETATRQRIKEIIIEVLYLESTTPEMIEDDMPLWGDGLGLDSVDALELMVALEQEYGFAIDNEEIDPEALGTVSGLAAFVIRHLETGGAEPRTIASQR